MDNGMSNGNGRRPTLGAAILKHHLYRLLGRRVTPPFITFFVTNRCDSECVHCFFWRDLNTGRDQELTLEEIDRFSRTMDPIVYLLIGGGEPYLRKDLPEIVEVFYRNNRLQNLEIPTGAQATRLIVAAARGILERCPGLAFNTTLSLDAVGERYDAIRGRKDAYRNAMATYEALRPLRDEHPNFSIRMCQTLMAQNQDVALETYAHQRDVLRPDILFVNYIRGYPLKPESKAIALHQYKALIDDMADDIAAGRWRNYRPADPRRALLNVLDVTVREMIYRTAKENRRQVRCEAGRTSGVIYSDGKVVECETKNTPYGNLRDVDYDFRRLWFTPAGREIRRNACDNCFCTHESSCFYPSLFGDPRTALRMALPIRRLRRALRREGHAAPTDPDR